MNERGTYGGLIPETAGGPWTSPEYLRGYLDGLWAYAWWKDGVAYVGSTGSTHAEAKAWALAEAREHGIDTNGF